MKHGCQALAIDEHRHEFVPTLWTKPAPDGVEIEQAWFAGAHADVGGGYVTRTLADIPLVWMARKAEQDGLKLDWSCLPDPNALQDLAPSHDSSSGLFSFDRFSPTFREVLQRPFAVSPFERLYAPLDNQGNRLRTIDEALHRSVVSRYGKSAPECVTDAAGLCNSETYAPKNLSPLFSTDGALVQERRLSIDPSSLGRRDAFRRQARTNSRRPARAKSLTVLFSEHNTDAVFGISEQSSVPKAARRTRLRVPERRRAADGAPAG